MLRFIKSLTSAFKDWFNRNSVDESALRDDLRKIGLSMTLMGFVGFILPQDKIDIIHALIILSAGIVIWSNGLINSKSKSDEDEDDGRK